MAPPLVKLGFGKFWRTECGSQQVCPESSDTPQPFHNKCDRFAFVIGELGHAVCCSLCDGSPSDNHHHSEFNGELGYGVCCSSYNDSPSNDHHHSKCNGSECDCSQLGDLHLSESGPPRRPPPPLPPLRILQWRRATGAAFQICLCLCRCLVHARASCCSPSSSACLPQGRPASCERRPACFSQLDINGFRLMVSDHCCTAFHYTNGQYHSRACDLRTGRRRRNNEDMLSGADVFIDDGDDGEPPRPPGPPAIRPFAQMPHRWSPYAIL